MDTHVLRKNQNLDDLCQKKDFNTKTGKDDYLEMSDITKGRILGNINSEKYTFEERKTKTIKSIRQHPHVSVADNGFSLDAPGIPSDELDQLVQAATNFIRDGNPEQAGRTINPVLSHLNWNQRTRIIEHLEPVMNALFRDAYMLMEYDRSEAYTSLEKIVNSGLKFLPSCGKAKSILESKNMSKSALNIDENLKDLH